MQSWRQDQAKSIQQKQFTQASSMILTWAPIQDSYARKAITAQQLVDLLAARRNSTALPLDLHRDWMALTILPCIFTSRMSPASPPSSAGLSLMWGLQNLYTKRLCIPRKASQLQSPPKFWRLADRIKRDLSRSWWRGQCKVERVYYRLYSSGVTPSTVLRALFSCISNSLPCFKQFFYYYYFFNLGFHRSGNKTDCILVLTSIDSFSETKVDCLYGFTTISPVPLIFQKSTGKDFFLFSLTNLKDWNNDVSLIASVQQFTYLGTWDERSKSPYLKIKNKKLMHGVRRK